MNIRFIVTCVLFFFFFACTEDSEITDFTGDREKFLGTWDVSESCSKNAYSVNIIKDTSNSSQVVIENFRHITECNNPPYAIIAGNSIVLPQQLICDDSFPYIVEGSGQLKNNVIKLNYYYKDEADSLNCSAVYNRQ